MSMLDRKLRRDLWRMRGQIISIAAVVGGGIAGVLAMGSTLESIRASRDAYYASAHFAHVFASLKRAPESAAGAIAAIPTVDAIQTRVTASALLRVPRSDRLATAHIVSLPPGRHPMLNALHLRRGREPTPSRTPEVVVGEHFALANDIEVGDSLEAVINGRWQRLHVVGIGLSPEFVENISVEFPSFPDNKIFGILWMSREALGPLYGMDQAFNDVVVSLAPGASDRPVIAALDTLLAPYGGGHSVGRKDQLSNKIVDAEIEQLAAYARAMPAIFLGVAAFLLNLVLSRLVATEREEIAILKAFGYSNAAIARHYLGYAGAAVLMGSVGGIPFGLWVASKYTALYADFFKFPVFTRRASPMLYIVAILVSSAAAALGALFAVRRAVALPPAEGMRPPSPPVYRPLLAERLGLERWLSPAARMILRNIERRPLRALMSILGVALAASVLIAGTFAYGSANYISELSFHIVEREAITVQFTGPRPLRARDELAHLSGVMGVEPFRTVPVRIHEGAASRLIAVTGLDRGAELRRLVDIDARAHDIPAAGIVLTTVLAEVLGVAPGDTVQLDVLERGGAARRVVVAGVLNEEMGIGGYMERSALDRLVGDGPSISGAWLAVSPDNETRVLLELARRPGVQSGVTRRAMAANYNDTLARSMGFTTSVVTTLACVIALGVLYNGARVALSERGRELASLRVLGFTRGEVSAILFGEQAILDGLGTPLGLLIGLLLAHVTASAFESELYRFPVVVTARTYAAAIAVVAAASVAAGIVIRRRLDRLDLVQVLKTRE